MTSWLWGDARASLAAAGLLLLAAGCASYSDHTKAARTALDAGNARAAANAYNQLLEVKSDSELPPDLKGDKVVQVLERSTILQQLDEYPMSSRDLEASDKNIEMLDFSRSTMDDISKFIFTDDAGPYQAPPYEKLMINTMNMLNYLVRGDLNGARIEARRYAVMNQYLSEHVEEGKTMTGPGSYLAGFVFEKSRQPGEALRYYDEALAYGKYPSLADPVRRLGKQEAYRTPRLTELIKGGEPSTDENPEILIVVNFGRVPAKIAKRVPIGLALTIASAWMTAASAAQANRLAAQGLVTWINFPSIEKPTINFGIPNGSLDQKPLPLEGLVAVDMETYKAWAKNQGVIVASAITRMITRIIAGEAARRASGGGTAGMLLSLGTQATMTAMDTPDTRGWSTLPARIAIARVRVPPGKHVIELEARGIRKRQEIDLKPGGWAVVNLTALR
ncbi:MAG TPA: hypothetical protein VJV78_19410 [Polyangiales bacterium]|nr:hypothetical protein [Polyangiales bacterium]